MDLLSLATALVDQLPAAVGVDAAAIVAFDRSGARSIAASDRLRRRFPPNKALSGDVGPEIAQRALSGPWLQAAGGSGGREADALELAFVPFGLGPAAPPIGCLVYGSVSEGAGALSHRLANLMDATEFAVTALRPAIEHAETTNSAILGLRRIIARRRFAVHLQPIARLDNGQVVGVEALTRFADGVRPDVRFAEAARLGMGQALERATLAAAVDAAASLPPNVALSVNVSPDVLQHERTLRDIVGRARRPVIIELTEHERIDDYDAVRSAFDGLGKNVWLAVDDAGSGYASLRHILSLRPSYVKLDMAWVRGIDADPGRRSLVSGLAYFATTTECELIAEGIETEAERAALLDLGVYLGQGVLLGRPVPGGVSPAGWKPGLDAPPDE